MTKQKWRKSSKHQNLPYMKVFHLRTRHRLQRQRFPQLQQTSLQK